MIVTVTMNAALDRILTVPNLQIGQRHRASEKLTMAGGAGVTIARTLRRLGIPVVATGFAGGRNGRRIVEELAGEEILNDFVRINDESRTSTAVVDPTSGAYTEIHEWGPHVEPEELDLLREKVDYLSRGAELVVFGGSLPRGVEDGFYAEMIRELSRRGTETVLATDGEPLRLGLEAEPSTVSTSQFGAETVVGQEFSDQGDLVLALDVLSEHGARDVMVTMGSGCFALVREDREIRRYHGTGPDVAPLTTIGLGAVMTAGYLAGRLDGLGAGESVRRAVAAAAASAQEVGHGRVDPRELGRLMPLVDVVELESVPEG